jgi:3-(3-hydroxy-phenyl)propionate hydroxylase
MTAPPILVVGAGPVGLCLALALARHGIPVEIFEAAPTLQSDLRGGAYHPPTLELFEVWGLLTELRRQGLEVRQLRYWERATAECVASFDYALIERDVRFPFRLHCAQHILCQIACAALRREPTARLHLSHRLVEMTETGDRVRARFACPGGPREVDGAWLCGTDGAHSTVRKQIGVAFAGLSYVDRFLVLNGDIGLDGLLPGLAPVNYFFDPEEWVIVLRFPGFTRVVFRIAEGQDEDAVVGDEAVRERLERFVGRRLRYRLHSRTVYRVHERLADTFRVGRVALAGDAAHINNPVGGMGLNSGLGDAYALAEALTAIHARGDASLLDSYTARRRAGVAVELAQRAGQNYREMSARLQATRSVRDRAIRAAAQDPALARAHLLQFSMVAPKS